jgi:glycosyltransferase involved in cell wall biosynthesis
LNEAIDLAKGRYFARMDQDDIAYPERLARQVDVLTQNPDLDLVAVRCLTISPENEPVGMLPYAEGHEEICARPWRGFYLPHPTWMGRIGWFRKYRYTIPEPHLCEDQDLLTRSYASSRFAVIPETLLAYRIRRKKSLKKLLRNRRSVLRMQLHNFMHGRQGMYALRAFWVFVIRVAIDLLNAMLPEHKQTGPHRARQLGDEELSKWQAVKESLHV